MKLLHIDTSILGDHSVSRRISAAVVARLRAVTPGLEIRYRDEAAQPLPHLSGAALAGQGEDLAAGAGALEEFLAADIVVIGAPMYNFTLPSQLKAWIDRILVAGKTFRYGEGGAEGLCGGKRVIVAMARGGFYGPEAQAAEHLETYLRFVFGFIGITDITFVAADGIQMGPDHRENAINGALQAVEALRAA
ncbi:FMN-dependent NADH-azoreductase [Labrys monachus]|uniref:FMN dependent NADH:quinone oxidoreductase n=1 Tax=Labrys monachus TaxID=217067 RepID=A0ABU0FB68_9HYPH|nr:NAD(P)H-dependent oxidoreductase [Labrys monachus]MDQ0391855.1 FMN-dependent NADH-azoreductase [Labrys monachus]